MVEKRDGWSRWLAVWLPVWFWTLGMLPRYKHLAKIHHQSNGLWQANHSIPWPQVHLTLHHHLKPSKIPFYYCHQSQFIHHAFSVLNQSYIRYISLLSINAKPFLQAISIHSPFSLYSQPILYTVNLTLIYQC